MNSHVNVNFPIRDTEGRVLPDSSRGADKTGRGNLRPNMRGNMRMSELLHLGPLGSVQSTDRNGVCCTARGIGARSAHLLWRASVVALGSSILVQPAMAQSTATPSAQTSSSTDDAAARNEAGADDPSAAVITVTGTLISNNENSPTPITAVETAEMAVTTPSDIADGLNKL